MHVHVGNYTYRLCYENLLTLSAQIPSHLTTELLKLDKNPDSLVLTFSHIVTSIDASEY